MTDSVRNTVVEVLREDPKTRNSDKWLIIQVLRKLGIKIFIDYSQINEMPSFESITRFRRFVQNQEGLYRADNKISNHRTNNQLKYREQYRRDNEQM